MFNGGGGRARRGEAFARLLAYQGQVALRDRFLSRGFTHMRKLSLRPVLGVMIVGGLGLVVLCGGCSASAAPSGPPTPAQFAGTVANSFCGSLQACCATAKFKYDSGSCVAQLQASFQTIVDSVKDGKVVYNANAVAACEQAIAQRESLCSNDGGAPSSADAGFVDAITAACWPIFQGTVAPGGECQRAQDCKTANPSVIASCHPDTRPSSGPTKKLCFISTAHVLPDGACRGVPAMGSFQTASCEATMGTCDVSGALPSDPGAGTCKAFLVVGDTCGGPSAGICNPTTSACSFQKMKCAALPNIGDPCPSLQCAVGAYCKSAMGPGTCAAQLVDGTTCQSGGDPRQCASGFCQPNGGGPNGICTGLSSRGLNDISPRSCGFGPNGAGDEDAGIQPPAGPQSMNDRLWFR